MKNRSKSKTIRMAVHLTLQLKSKTLKMIQLRKSHTDVQRQKMVILTAILGCQKYQKENTRTSCTVIIIEISGKYVENPVAYHPQKCSNWCSFLLRDFVDLTELNVFHRNNEGSENI